LRNINLKEQPMRMRLLIGSLVAVLPAAGALRAQEMPKPAPEMKQIAFFEGTWTCKGKSHESPFGPAGDLTGSVEVKRDLGGFWQSGTVKGTMANMPPFEGRFHVTYDPGGKQLMMLWVDNMGGWAQSTSRGWSGDTLVYEGESHMGPQSFKARDTFTRSGSAAMKHTWEANISGKWTVLGEETCQKK
jgi:hypothetical protein